MTQLKRGFTAHPKRGDTAHSRIKRGQPTEVTQPSKRIKINKISNSEDNSNIEEINITNSDSLFENSPEPVVCLIHNVSYQKKNNGNNSWNNNCQ